MRAIHILFFLLIIIFNGCTAIEVAEGVAKVSIKVAEKVRETKSETITMITENEKKDKKIKSVDTLKEKEESVDILKEKEEVVIEKRKEKIVANKQKKITAIKILGESLDQLTQNFGKPKLIREDGNVKVVRFDTSSCRLFIYFDLLTKKSKAEYFEIRDTKGRLIEKKHNINKCFQEIQKV